MNSLLEMVRSGTEIGKGLFLMVCGMGFVFTVQLIFFLIIRLWPREKSET